MSAFYGMTDAEVCLVGIARATTEERKRLITAFLEVLADPDLISAPREHASVTYACEIVFGAGWDEIYEEKP